MDENDIYIRDRVVRRLQHFIHKLQAEENIHEIEPILNAIQKITEEAQKIFHCPNCDKE